MTVAIARTISVMRFFICSFSSLVAVCFVLFPPPPPSASINDARREKVSATKYRARSLPNPTETAGPDTASKYPAPERHASRSYSRVGQLANPINQGQEEVMKLFTSVAVTSLLAVLAATGHAQVIDKKALSLDGKVIGAIGVSGESPAQDEEIAIAGANAAKD